MGKPDSHWFFVSLQSKLASMTNYIEELNESQREAVLYCDGPQLVVAGAGSGKTRVLTYKIAYLLEQGYEPWSILALTFTNKAAREMKSRIARQVGENKARYLWMGTFHSVFSRILRQEAETIGFSPNFTIYDAADSKNLIKAILKDKLLDEKVYKPSEVQRRISNAKNRLLTAEEYAKIPVLLADDREVKMERIYEIYQIYEQRCRVSDVMDFDDLLLHTFLLFKNHPDVCRKYATQFKYLLVDEYQDTNHAQHCIVMQLASVHTRVCVVGDDAQSIYSFRGANIDNILSFPKLFEQTKIFKLEQNYRSTQFIVNAANSLIAKNSRQIQKDVYSMKELGEPIPVLQAFNDVEEGEMVVNQLNRLKRNGGYSNDDFAILYRTNAQSRIFEEVLRKRGIAYVVYGGLSFYQRKEIKDAIAYFRVAVNPNDEEALKRIINYPARGIGDKTVLRVSSRAIETAQSLWQIIDSDELEMCGLNKGTIAKVQGFREMVRALCEKAQTVHVVEAAQFVITESKLMLEFASGNTPEDMSRRENMYELMNGVEAFYAQRMEERDEHCLLADFLSEVALLTDQDEDGEADEPKVTLMTVHAAKGLEFKNVFVVGLEENLFPSYMYADSVRNLEEERRLFYVAITRAEEHCYLSHARMRYRYGRMELNQPSRFLRDIATQYLKDGPESETPRQVSVSQVKTEPQQHLRRISVESSKHTEGPVSASHQALIGKRIEHERFGCGEVLAVEGNGDNAKARVRFDESGEKQLLFKYARFRVIDD